jgi:hypothetical protein
MASSGRVDPSITPWDMDAPSRPPLRGRERELAVIRRRRREVRAGTGSVVVVEGSAGLGKTRLLLHEVASLIITGQEVEGRTPPERNFDFT